MEQEPFCINNRFYIDPAINVIKEIKGTNEIRLEPRLMHLLCLLSLQQGKVVSREFLIREIWNDYGGADEGLTQAVSFLRKTIGDQHKEIIETVPKKGYILHAAISRNISEKNMIIEKPYKNFNPYWLTPVAIVILISGYLFFNKSSSKTSLQSSQTAQIEEEKTDSIKHRSTDTSFPDFSKDDEENYLNTITTTDANGVKYRLVMIGDRRPKFYVDDKLFTNDVPEKYTLLIDNLSKELWERQRKASEK